MNKILRSLVPLAFMGPWSCTPNAKAPRHIMGEVEVKEVDLASRISARIDKISVREGQKVKEGDRLISFDDDIFKQRKSRALADLSAARSQKQIADSAVRPEEITQLIALVDSSQRQAEFAENTLKRMSKLLSDGAISQQQFEEVEFKYHAAKAKYVADSAKLKMAEVGARDEQKSQAKAIVTKAETGVAEVQAYDKDLVMVAPFDGEIFQILAHRGELVPQGFSALTILDMSQIWATFRVPETDLKVMAMDQKVQIHIRALDQTINGMVSYISPMSSFATRTFTQDKSSFDLKTFEVRVSLDQVPPNLRPGMTAELIQ